MTVPSPASRPSAVPALAGAAVLDVAAVAVFVAVGRATHDEASSVTGYLHALWPFLVGLADGWLVCLVIGARTGRPAHVVPGTGTGRPAHVVPGDRWAPYRVFPAGVLIWVNTVVVGMVLRWVTDQGVATAFVVVASIATAILLLGWRSIALILSGRPIRG